MPLSKASEIITTTEYFKPLIRSFEGASDMHRADQMSRYMKNLFPFHGIDTKTRSELQKQFFAEQGWPKTEQLFACVWYLWELPQREYQMTAINLLQKYQTKLVLSDIDHLEKLIVTKSWWDSVDGLAAWICGAYFIKFPEQIWPITSKWMASGNMWLQRSCLLFQLKYKLKTDPHLLSEFVINLKAEQESFIRKAIGWILREYSKVNPDWVRSFLLQTELSGLSRREASKYV